MVEPKKLLHYFEEFSKECKYYTRLSGRTIAAYRAVFRRFQSVMPEIQECRDLSPEILTEFFHRLDTLPRNIGRDKIAMGIKSSTIRTYWNKLKPFFNWLVKKGLLQTNPFIHMRPPEVSYEDDRTLSSEEIKQIYAAISIKSSNIFSLRRDTAMLSTLVYCGIRFGEFVALEIRDIDFDKRLLTVRAETSKCKRTRHIPIHPTLILHLKDYFKERLPKHSTPYLWISTLKGQKLSTEGVRHWVKRLNLNSGVKFHVHRFRHTFAQNLAIANVNTVKIQKLLGHSSVNMTMTYLRGICEEDLHEDISKLSI